MRLRAQLALVKRIDAGTGVSYGWTWTAPEDTVVGLVPLGYADGVPRHAGNTAEVEVRGRRAPVRGRICMDQLVVELGPGSRAEPGDEVTLFGRRRRRAHRGRLGRRLRDDRLRDRHPDRRPGARGTTGTRPRRTG